MKIGVTNFPGSALMRCAALDNERVMSSGYKVLRQERRSSRTKSSHLTTKLVLVRHSRPFHDHKSGLNCEK